VNRLLADNSLICIKKRLIGMDPLLRPDQLAWFGIFAHLYVWQSSSLATRGKKMSPKFWVCIAAIAILAAAVAADAQPRRVQVGTLSCSVSAGIGLIVASQRNVNCNFQPDNGPPEAYTGTMTIVGVDVGFTTGSAIVWGVFTNTSRFAGMLTGTYAGVTAQATAVAGIGANALVGGSNHSVSLQPLSVQGQVGLNAAGGIGALELHYAQ
jgi:hypothetical protein